MMLPSHLSAAGRTGERAKALGDQLDLAVGETVPSFGRGQPAVVGATGELAKQLKALGAHWSRRDRALIFSSWAQLEGILSVVMDRLAARPSTVEL
jgi:hypothetical protein